VIYWQEETMRFSLFVITALVAGLPSSCERNLNKGLQEEKSYTRAAMEKYRQDPKYFHGCCPGVLENWSRMDYVSHAIEQQKTAGNWAKTTDELSFLERQIQRDSDGKHFCAIHRSDEIVVLRILAKSVSCTTELAASVDTSRISSGDMEFSGRTDYWVYVLRPGGR
jgi:hypothetical protein